MLLLFSGVFAQEKVTFLSVDSLKITADLYLKDYNLPFILLFHQGSSSRGEYAQIAPRLVKLDYNCLAVDLRSGDKINYISNETAREAKQNSIPQAFLDTRKDIEASVNYVRKFNSKPILLFGSSYSASLCLIFAAGNPDINAVIAFSPGEYFRPQLIVKDRMKKVTQPVFISATSVEYEFVMQMLADIPAQNKFIYTPAKGKGEHGAKMLWPAGEWADECWLDLLLFFKKIRY
jgi:pimeloyl-ACP methyl ester carboxylesterase